VRGVRTLGGVHPLDALPDSPCRPPTDPFAAATPTRARAALAEIGGLVPAVAGRRELPVEIADVLSTLTGTCLPARLGGAGRPLTELVRLVEAVSRVDAGVGWCLFILGSAPWLWRCADDRLLAEIGPHTRLAGSLAPAGTARRTRSGYVVDGSWPFGSAVGVAHQVVVRAVVPDEGPRCLVVPRADVTTRPWDGAGLALSGSGAFRLDEVEVPAYRVLGDLDGPSRWPELCTPFRATFAAGAAVLIGIAAAAVAEVARAHRPGIDALVGWAASTVQAARAALTDAVRRVQAGGNPYAQAGLRLAVVRVREYCLDVVDRLHLAAGAAVTAGTSVLGRLFADAHTASQHKMFGGDVDRLGGAALLGRPDPTGHL
jgi:alkylation response protein AidB-like acyl-CoA dehydrogenase